MRTFTLEKLKYHLDGNDIEGLWRLVVKKRFHFSEPLFGRFHSSVAIGHRREQAVHRALQLRQRLFPQHDESHLVRRIVAAPRINDNPEVSTFGTVVGGWGGGERFTTLSCEMMPQGLPSRVCI